MGFFDKDENSSGTLSSELAVDTSHIRGAVGDQVGLATQNVVTFVAGYIIAFIANWKLTLVLTAVLPLIVVSAVVGQKFQLGQNNKVHDPPHALSPECRAVAGRWACMTCLYPKAPSQCQIASKQKSIQLTPAYTDHAAIAKAWQHRLRSPQATNCAESHKHEVEPAGISPAAVLKAWQQ